MSLIGVEVTKGDRVQLTATRRLTQMNSTHTFEISETEELEVTGVFQETLLVRTVQVKSVPRTWSNPENRRVSFQVNRDLLQLADPNRPAPRRLGQAPEGDHIDVDDPRIQWLFNDMGKYADDKGYCAEYDKLTARLGIPGRPRDFSVHFKLGDIAATTVVKARSQKEANEIVAAASKAAPTFTDAA